MTAALDDKQREELWNEWLEGASVAWAARWFEVPRRVVEEELGREPPERFRQDLRYLRGSRFFWVHIEGPDTFPDGGEAVLAVVESPRRYTTDAFRRALRKIAAEVRGRSAQHRLNPVVMEGFGADCAAALSRAARGCAAFRFDEAGVLFPIDPRPRPDSEEPPGMAP